MVGTVDKIRDYPVMLSPGHTQMHGNSRAARRQAGLQRGQGRIEISRVEDRSVITRAAATNPLKLLTPSYGTFQSSVFACTYGGGLVANDRIDIQMNLADQTSAFLGTQASTKVYRCPQGKACRQDLEVTAGHDATLVSMPDPVTCFTDANYRQTQRFNLQATSALVMLDWMTSGRMARGERWAFSRYRSDTEINIGHKCVYSDALLLDPADGPIDAAYRMGRFNCLANLVLVGDRLSEICDQLLVSVKSIPLRRTSDMICTVSPFDHGLVLRVVAKTTQQAGTFISEQLGFVEQLLGVNPWSRKW
jgi:urease accessory protein